MPSCKSLHWWQDLHSQTSERWERSFAEPGARERTGTS